MASFDLPENFYLPAGHVDQLATELSKSYEEARAALLERATKLHMIYGQGGSMGKYWNSLDLAALNALLMNRTLRRKDAERAAKDLDHWEMVMQSFPDRLHRILTETKFSAFQAYIQKARDEITMEHWPSFRVLVEKCKKWSEAKEAPKEFEQDDEQLYKMMTNMRSQLSAQIQQMVPKRLELALKEIDKHSAQPAATTTPPAPAAPAPSKS
jgi:hypothetical protein